MIDVEKDPKLPGNVLLNFTRVIKKIKNERQHEENLRYIRQWLDEYNYLKVNSFQGFFYGRFVKAIQKLGTGNPNATTILHYNPQGPAHTINVEAKEDKQFSYSVDFVPGILLNEEQSIIPIKGQWEAIPKPNKKDNSVFNSFRASYYQQEHKIIEDKKQLKTALRLMKKFRDVNELDKIKSYFIKTLFLHKAKKEPISYWNRSLEDIIVDVSIPKCKIKGTKPAFFQYLSNLINKFFINS